MTKEIAFILCSSGTTGMPKGVSISHATFSHDFAVVKYEMQNCFLFIDENIIFLCRVDGLVTFTASSLYWASSLLGLFHAAIAKSSPRVITCQPINGVRILEIIEKYKINSSMMAPVYIAQISEELARKSYDLSNLLVLQTGGSALPEATRAAFTQFYPKVIIMAGYGMTDIGGVTFNIVTAKKPKAVGQLLNGVKVKVSYF